MINKSEDLNNDELQPWNAKAEIAQRIIPVIKSYRDLMVSENSYSIPNWVVDKDESLDENEVQQRWLDYLELMIKAFELEIKDEVASELKLKEQAYGLNLFAKYYVHLWD